MADFLQRDLEREKLKSMKIENAFVEAKETQLKDSEKERANTSAELMRLKNEISLIQEQATKNSNDAEEAVRVQEAAKLTAQMEVTQLRETIVSLRS